MFLSDGRKLRMVPLDVAVMLCSNSTALKRESNGLYSQQYVLNHYCHLCPLRRVAYYFQD